MKKLKEFRQKLGQTQAQIAASLGVVQQTYGRWERGIDEPSLEHLTKLATLFKTSVDHLIGKIDRTLPSYISGDLDGFWGHVGLKFAWEDDLRWWPISTSTRNHLINNLNSRWLYIATTAGRTLLVNASAVEVVTLLDDAGDTPRTFNKMGFGYEGLSDKTFNELKEWALIQHEGPRYETTLSDSEFEQANMTAKNLGLTTKAADVFDWTIMTITVSNSGHVQKFEANEQSLVELAFHHQMIESGDGDSLLAISEIDETTVHLIPLNCTALIDFPTPHMTPYFERDAEKYMDE